MGVVEIDLGARASDDRTKLVLEHGGQLVPDGQRWCPDRGFEDTVGRNHVRSITSVDRTEDHLDEFGMLMIEVRHAGRNAAG